jgi:hypothetical protein
MARLKTILEVIPLILLVLGGDYLGFYTLKKLTPQRGAKLQPYDVVLLH